MAWAGAPVGRAYALLLQGGFGSRFAWTETLTRATPLILTGLAAAVAFRARLFNIGAEGQLYAGALAAVAVGGLHGGAGWPLPGWLLFPPMIAAAALAGALLLLGPALLKARLGVDEVVTTLLLNFIVLLLVSAMLDGPMKDPTAMGWPQSVALADALQLDKLIPRSRVHTGLLAALALAVALCGLLRHTTLGFEIRAVGANARAAAFAGMPVRAVEYKVALLSGALAGLAGAIEVAGRTGYVTLDMSPGYGYSRHRDRDARGAASARRGRRGGVRGRHAGRCRQHEPRGERADLHRRRDRRGLVARDAGGDAGRALARALSLKPQHAAETFDLLLAAPFWVAVLRIATPLILGTLGVLLCERAGVLNLGIEGIMVAGAFAGWLTVYQGGGLWAGVAVAALTGAVFGLLHGCADGGARRCRSTSPGWASRCWPPAWRAMPIA